MAYKDNNRLTTAITAYSGGGNASAVLLASTYNIVSVSAAHLDSVRLPDDLEGPITVVNDGAKDVGVFPPLAVAAQIDSLGADTAYPLASGSTQQFYKASATLWRTLNKGLRYVARTNVASNDYEIGDLTMDASWNLLDTSALFPPSAYSKPAVWEITIMDAGAANGSFGLSTFAVPGAVALVVVDQVAAAVTNVNQGAMPTTAAGKIYYRGVSSTDVCSITMLGYWVEG